MWSVVLRCDASPAIGFGHLFRSLALALELVDRDVDVTFAVADGPEAAAIVEREGYKVIGRDGLHPDQREGWLDGCVARARADVLVLDVRDESPRSGIDALRASGVLVATIDDPTERRLSADLAFYPPIPQVEEFDWGGFSGTRLVGGDWIVLRRAFAEAPVRRVRERPTVLVTMGGSDPAGMTLTAVDAITRMTERFDLTVVLGPGYRDRDRLQARLARIERPVAIVEQPADIRAVMLDADVAIASFGVTAYELAATATPAMYLCLTADHARSATLFEQHGAGLVLGVHTGDEAPLVAQMLAQTLAAWLADPDRSAAMGRAGRALIDGRGAARVADRIITELAVRQAHQT